MLTLISAAITIIAADAELRAVTYLFKPLTTGLILLIALLAQRKSTLFYRNAIAIGLLFSLAGDVFLMLPADLFLQGLISFLLAHLCYIAAFTSKTGWRSSVLAALPFVIYTALLLWILWPHVGAMKLPVLIYGSVLGAMAWRACEMWRQHRGLAELSAFIGAVLFLISDSALAYHRFVQVFSASRLVVLGTYFVAQLLIARSV